jgi:hypothetical protein
LQKSKEDAGQITTWLQQRYYWGDFAGEIRKALIRSEADIQKKLSAQKANVDVGIWVEQMISSTALGASTAVNQNVPMPGTDMPPPNPNPVDPNTPPGTANTNSVITLICRSVNLTSLDPSANSEIAYAVENEIKNSPLVDPKATALTGQITPDDSNGTFTFTVSVMPLNPLNF